METNNAVAVTVKGNDLGLAIRVERRSQSTGKLLGTRFNFCGQETAKSLKEIGKGKGLKGDKLSEFVNASLTGDSAKASAVLAAAFVADYTANGGVWLFGERTGKAGKGAMMRGEMPKAAKVVKEDGGKIAKLIAMLEAAGMSTEEITDELNAE